MADKQKGETVITMIVSTIEAAMNKINQVTVNETAEVLGLIRELITRVNIMSEMLKTANKPRAVKTIKSGDAPDSEASASQTTTETPPRIYNNKMYWFKGEFADKEEFREKWLTLIDKIDAGYRKTMEGNQSVINKKVPKERLKAKATLTYAFIKDNKALTEILDKEFSLDKVLQTKMNKAEQQNVEEDSPIENN